ncbi:MAG: OFA family MFS transporter [Acidobacteria bacterium]|nr:OFA family MFS transporter [Acidobacteriota bacterium]
MNRWLPVVGGVSMNLALGSLYAWSVFVAPLEQEFGWSRTQTSWTFTIAVLTFAASFILAGRIQDMRGPRICATVGGVLVGVGFILSSFTTSLWQLYIFFGLIVGLGNGFGYATPVPVASKWFPDKRGLVVGIMVGGYGAGSAIFGPVAGSLIESVGWRPTFQILGVLFFIMGMIGAWLQVNPPAGYVPDGWTPPQTGAAAQVGKRDFLPSEMVRTSTFAFLWVAYCLGVTAGLMVISQLVPFAGEAGLSAAAIAALFTITAVGNGGGRILSGWLSDTLGRLTTLRVMVLVSAIAMPALYASQGSVLLFYLLAMLVYACYGTQLSVFASTTADFFGTRNLGMNYGLLFSAWGVAGFLGPWIGGQVFDAFGDYRYAFYAGAALALVSLGSLSLARPPAEPAKA